MSITQSSLYIQLFSDCHYAILSHNIKHLKLSEPDLLVLTSRKSSHRCLRSGLDARDRAPQPAVARHGLDACDRGPHVWPASLATVSTPAAKICRGLPRRGLDAGARDSPWWPAAFATVSTPAAEDRIFGQPPSPPSRRRWPRSVAASLAAVSTPAAERSRMWPASLATVSTPAAEIRRGGPPPSPRRRSRRRRPRSAGGPPPSQPAYLV